MTWAQANLSLKCFGRKLVIWSGYFLAIYFTFAHFFFFFFFLKCLPLIRAEDRMLAKKKHEHLPQYIKSTILEPKNVGPAASQASPSNPVPPARWQLCHQQMTFKNNFSQLSARLPQARLAPYCFQGKVLCIPPKSTSVIRGPIPKGCSHYRSSGAIAACGGLTAPNLWTAHCRAKLNQGEKIPFGRAREIGSGPSDLKIAKHPNNWR